MMLSRSWFAGLCVGLIFAAPVVAEDVPDWKFCKSDNDLPEARVVADCTEFIEAKDLGASDRAKAYYLRGTAYWRHGDPDRAIADENKAIELDTKFIEAYVRRGAAYLRSGDVKAAIADFTRA